ncbi:M20 family metallopeptidase [Cohnella sp. REN36]|uniref:M20 metallopeptidase family protein n=1 Tax=Cohnella sp. REN36 TaxID=2887347 RepID=UPI001D140779|nr:amidohydrolase [Cohnella sp. REN36]MCC3374789.1 amidohydrolase [Cohnella sp. REN36]
MNDTSLAELLPAARKLEEKIIGLRRRLHQYPELSLEEAETSAVIEALLEPLGLDVRRGVGGYGVIADLQGGKPGPLIALRADMDALPVQEETGLPFASRVPGRMHACGHDAHTAMLYGAAKLLVERRSELAGGVRFIFQAAEEVNEGARAIVEAGGMAGVDEIYGLHNSPTLPVGTVATRVGGMMGSVDRFSATIQGRGGHGAMPEQCVDPVVAASAIVLSLQTAVSRELSPFDPAVVTVGSIHGGNAYNVIPDRVEIEGTVRTFSARVRDQLPVMLGRLVGGVAEAHRCTAEVRYLRMVPALENREDNVCAVNRVTRLLLGENGLTEAAPVLAGEDFSVYLERVPGCFFWLGAGPQANADQAYGLHHPKYTIDEDCLAIGAAVLAAIPLYRGFAG